MFRWGNGKKLSCEFFFCLDLCKYSEVVSPYILALNFGTNPLNFDCLLMCLIGKQCKSRPKGFFVDWV